MTAIETSPPGIVPLEEIQQGWQDLKTRVAQLEAERHSLEQENKSLRLLLEKVIEHRQRSHGELVLLLTGLVSKLPINEVGVLVSKLVEHNTHVSEVCSVLAKGSPEAELPQPMILKALEQAKRDLAATLKTAVDELLALDSPLEAGLLRALVAQPESFFSPAFSRAHRCLIKAQVPRERILREFGQDALALFNDMTTDSKRNPRPKPEEIALGFKEGFESLLASDISIKPDQRQALTALYQRVQCSKGSSETVQAQRDALNKISFVIELLHYYEHQSVESPEVAFAQRLPALIEQLAAPSPQAPLEEKRIVQAESLLNFILNPDYRFMVINNIGKGGGTARALKFVLRLRADKVPDQNEIIPEFVRFLVPRPPQKPPPAAALVPLLGLIKRDMQALVVRALMASDRMNKDEATALGRTIGSELGLTGLEAPPKTPEALPVEIERQFAWEKIKVLIDSRADPAAVAAAIRDRLHSRYEADELKQSWITLTDTDPISLIRVFCQLPYLADGRTDPLARTVMETYVSRLTHAKYAATYTKVVNSLKNMFKANPHSPTLTNFINLVRWIDSDAAQKLSAEIGMQ